MSIFVKLEGNPKIKMWIWFAGTCIGGLVPIFLRLIIGLGKNTNLPLMDVKDIYFFALALNLSNLNLVGHSKFKAKDAIVTLSSTLIIIIAACIGALISEDFSVKDLKNQENNWYLGCALLFSVCSFYLSLEANKYVLEKVKSPRS